MASNANNREGSPTTFKLTKPIEKFAIMKKVLVIGYPCRLCGCDLTKGGPKFSLLGGKELSTRADYTIAFETLVGPVRLGDGLPTAICIACRELLGSYVQTKATLDQICSEIKSKACKSHNVTTGPAKTDIAEQSAYQVQSTPVNIDCTAVGQIKAELVDCEHAINRTANVCPVCGSSTGISQKTLCVNQMNIKSLKPPTSMCPDAHYVMLHKSCTPPQTQNASVEKIVQVSGLMWIMHR